VIRTFLTLIALSASLAAEDLVLKNFTLIDGTGRPPLAHAALLVHDGWIRWAGPVKKLKAPAGAQSIDLTGRYVMPGIVNLHGHIGNVIGLKQDPKFYTRENVEKNLQTFASYGVTTVLSLGTDQDLIFQIRDEQRSGRPRYSRVFTAGRGFTVKGGIGGAEGVTFFPDSTAEVPAQVDELAAQKVDIVKMWVDDRLGHSKKMPPEISQAILDSARRNHLRTAAHIYYLEDAQRLLNGGVDMLAHSVRDRPVTPEFVAEMKKRGVVQVPTLTRELSTFVYAHPPAFLDDPFFSRAVAPETIATLRSQAYQDRVGADPDFPEYPGFLDMAKKNLKTLSDAGVKIGFGTDTGPPGRFLGYFEHLELELMVDAGLTPMQAIRAATGTSGEFLRGRVINLSALSLTRSPADVGTLEPGKWADLLVLTRDPLAEIKNTRSIEAVYIAGRRVSP
jgi:imidazolonepropionase-like amidohydrolase